MKKWLLVLTSCIVVNCLPIPVEAQETGAVSLTYKTQEGIWFPAEMAKSIQKDIEELNHLRQVIKLTDAQLKLREERFEIKDARIAQLNEALQLSIQAESRSKGVVEAAVRGRRQAEEDLDSFWRSPGLFISIGVVSVVLVEVAAVAILNSI
jgi:hypothetical protein